MRSMIACEGEITKYALVVEWARPAAAAAAATKMRERRRGGPEVLAGVVDNDFLIQAYLKKENKSAITPLVMK